jgi:hypothetical protein
LFGREKVGQYALKSAGDWELRQLIAAARNDVARLRDRVRSGHALAARWRAGDTTLTGQQQRDAEMLAQIAGTGIVPCLDCRNTALTEANRTALASEAADITRQLASRPALPPLLQARLTDRRSQITRFLSSYPETP